MIVPQLGCKVFADWPKGRQGPSLVCFSCQMNTLCCLTRSTHDHGKRLVSLLNSSISENLFVPESKEIGDFIDEYFTGANSAPEDEIIGEETDDRSDVLELKSVAVSSEFDVSVRVNYKKSEELEEELD